jgi:hypothetical protein
MHVSFGSTNVTPQGEFVVRSDTHIDGLKDRIREKVSSIPSEMCVQSLNRTVARWHLCVEHDGQQVKPVL